MDQEHGFPQLPSHDVAVGECRSCAIARRVAGQRTPVPAPYPAEAVDQEDEEAVVISEPGLNGLVVVPRRHIGGLDELSIPRRAHVLAALRRAARSVRYANPRSRVIVTTNLPASQGHVCFQVLPNGSDDPPGLRLLA